MLPKTIIITGASRGIGRATALRFARAGHQIVAVARNEEALLAVANEIRAAGGQCETVAGDVAQRNTADEAVSRARSRFGRLDVLVNNAGVAPLVAIEELTMADFERCLATNIAAVFHMTQAAWSTMRQQREGTIVNISSRASVDPLPGFAVYGACKAWVNTFTQAIAAEGKSSGIKAFSIAPGGVETEMFRELFADYPAEKVLAPEDVAGLVEAVCTDEMINCTGQTIHIAR